MSFITIIIPVFNIASYLPDCLDSIIAQTYQNWNCILINDGSTDDSQKVIDAYCHKDSRFNAYHKNNEKSADLARKYAFQFVKTEWVMQIDGDDVIVLDYLERMIQRQIETSSDMVLSRFIGCLQDVEGVNFVCPNENFDMNQVLPGYQVCIDNIGGWSSSINGALYKLSLIDNVFFGPYMNSDEYSQRLIEFNATRVAFCDVQYLYRNNIGTSLQVSVRMFDRTLVDIQLERFVYDFFPERKDKIIAMAWQRLFNLIYLTADFCINKDAFAKDEQEKAEYILKESYKALNRKSVRIAAPVHALMLAQSFKLFSRLATYYVRYKRSHGGNYFYR